MQWHTCHTAADFSCLTGFVYIIILESQELAAVNLVWIFNGFKYNGRGNEGSTALFAVASKINHSCRPNVAYQSYG